MKTIIRTILIFMAISTSVAFIYYNYFKSEGGDHHDAARAHFGLFKTALAKYKLDEGAYPLALVFLWVSPATTRAIGKGHTYMDGDEEILDAWRRPFKYELFDRGQRCKITSAGADGLFGTPDDKFAEYRD
jgi:hypothetical protein